MSLKTKKNRAHRTKQPAAAKVNTLPAPEGTLLAHQVSEAAGKQAVTQPNSGQGQRHENLLPAGQVTTVEARIDVGFGNSIFIRGQGAGLSWDKGFPLSCVNSSAWVWSTKRAEGKVVFKLLLNDQAWAKGEDVVVEAGRTIQLVPVF